MVKVFPEPHLVGLKRQRNLRDHIIRATVPAPTPPYPAREKKGMTKCGKCSICPFVKEGTSTKIATTKHRGYVTSKVVTQPTGAHFNLPGHSMADQSQFWNK